MIIECEILAHSSICVRIKLVWPIRRCVTSLRGIEMDESRFIGDKFIVSIEKKKMDFFMNFTLSNFTIIRKVLSIWWTNWRTHWFWILQRKINMPWYTVMPDRCFFMSVWSNFMVLINMKFIVYFYHFAQK